MKGLGIILILIFVYCAVPSCTPETFDDNQNGNTMYGASGFGGTEGEDATAETEATDDDSSGETEYSSPESEEGYGIPITIGKTTLPSIDGRYLSITASIASDAEPEEEVERSAFNLGNFFLGIRSAHASEEAGTITISCLKCVDMDSMPSSASPVVVIQNNDREELVKTDLEEDGSFTTKISGEVTDSISMNLRDTLDDTAEGAKTIITITSVNTFDISLTTDFTDKFKPIVSYFSKNIGCTTQTEATKTMSMVPLSGGEVNPLFEIQAPLINVQWGQEGKSLYYMKEDQSLYQYNAEIEENKLLAGPPTTGYIRDMAVAPFKPVMAISDDDPKESGTPFKIVDLSTWTSINGFEIDLNFFRFTLKFTPDEKTLVIIGTERIDTIDPQTGNIIYTSGNTHIFHITSLEEKPPVITEIWKGSITVNDWIVTGDNKGIIFVSDGENGYTQIFNMPLAPEALPQPITNSLYHHRGPTISYDRKWLAFTQWSDDINLATIHVINLEDDPSKEMPLTVSSFYPYKDPSFVTADPVLIYTTIDNSGYSQVYIKNLDMVPELNN